MKRLVSRAILGLCLTIIAGTPTMTSAERPAPVQDTRSRFVGSWRLVSLEHTGPDGKVDKADCSGQFIFTADGHAAVQVMYKNSGQAESTQYAQGGYEATFGRYTVNEQARTFTFHVDGALVRALVGQDLPRTYAFTGNQLTVGPVNQAEGWRVVWARN
jgi:lipocalin-like protein